MANSLTGDFDFVVEVSDATLDRLAAAMHQNGFSNPATPSLPHLAYFRIGGDPTAIGGERGSHHGPHSALGYQPPHRYAACCRHLTPVNRGNTFPWSP
jgi:hypothetical protein